MQYGATGEFPMRQEAWGNDFQIHAQYYLPACGYQDRGGNYP
jgi:hypothetical protein